MAHNLKLFLVYLAQFLVKWPSYNQDNWNYMIRNRCQHIIFKIFEENCYTFIFYLLINFKFLKDAISGMIFYTHISKYYQLALILKSLEFVSKMRYLCFDLILLSKINQIILVAIFFLDLRSKLQMVFFVTFYLI